MRARVRTESRLNKEGSQTSFISRGREPLWVGEGTELAGPVGSSDPYLWGEPPFESQGLPAVQVTLQGPLLGKRLFRKSLVTSYPERSASLTHHRQQKGAPHINNDSKKSPGLELLPERIARLSKESEQVCRHFWPLCKSCDYHSRISCVKSRHSLVTCQRCPFREHRVPHAQEHCDESLRTSPTRETPSLHRSHGKPMVSVVNFS